MSLSHTPEDLLNPSHKGKGRSGSSEVTEQTPLLGSQSNILPGDPENISLAHRSLWSKLTLVFFASSGICLIVFLVLALIAYEYAARASSLSTEDLLNSALVTRGPDRVDVLNVTEDGGMWVKVAGGVGIDAGSVIDLSKDKRHWLDFFDSWARWGIRKLDRVSVDLSTITVTPSYDNQLALASLEAPWLEIPVTTDHPNNLSWLTNFSVPLFVRPTKNASALVQFMRDAWRNGAITMHANVGRVVVRGGSLHETGWRRHLRVVRLDTQAVVRMPIPPIPGFPTPGRDAPFPDISQLITLQAFDVLSESHNVTLHARATLIDPAPLTFNMTSPSIPFIISLPPCSDANTSSETNLAPVVSILTEPFTLTHPNITLLLSGVVLPLPLSSAPLISAFVSAYLSGRTNSIIISTPLLNDLFIDYLFPAPHPKPQILRNVTIHDMKIKPSTGGPFLASGTVFVRVVLPKGMNVVLDVNRVLPDVLIFDGEVPDPSFGEEESPPLPDPLPERAFAHIRPPDWLDSQSEPDDEDEDEGSAYSVSAKFVDVPLEVLPGRQKEFSDFMRKVIFGHDGAIAGILGSGAVAVEIHGLPLRNGTGKPAEIEFTGLPLKGKVRIGKKSLFHEEGNGLLAPDL